MNDLISRQKLLTELDRYIDAHQGHGFENVRVILRGLKREIIDFPCVQPQQTCEYWGSESKFCALCRPAVQPQVEIIRCKDCMHNGSFDTDCPINWNGKEYCSFAERRTDEQSG